MSFWELALIAIIALIVLGPERLPKAARTIGLWVGKAKHGFESIKTEIDRELKVKELQEQLLAQKEQLENNSGLNSLKEKLDESVNSIHNQSDAIKNSVEDKISLDDQQHYDAPGQDYQPEQESANGNKPAIQASPDDKT
jgi:sec-independent protein translocase protein TatB